jgi:hypothetical protein
MREAYPILAENVDIAQHIAHDIPDEVADIQAAHPCPLLTAYFAQPSFCE